MPPSTSASNRNRIVGAAIGGVFGGLILIIGLCMCCNCGDRKDDAPKIESNGSGVLNPPYSQQNSQLESVVPKSPCDSLGRPINYSEAAA